MYYINVFLFFSILGYFLEEMVIHNYNSGVLYGPWTFVYGFGMLLVMFIYKLLNNFKLNKKVEMFFLFLISSVILSVLELLSGYLILYFRHVVYWDYTSLRFNIGRFISLETAIIWGIVAVIANYFVLPKVKYIIGKVPSWLTYIILIFICFDFFISNLI